MSRPGASGLISAQAVSGAAPDGYALAYLHSGHLVLQATEGKPNILIDFTPIGLFSASQFCIGVAADSPYLNFADLLNAIEKSPGKLNYGAGGEGSPGHIAFEKLVSLRPSLKVVQVPYKAALESVVALIGKQIDFVSGVFGTVLSAHRTGRVRILAVTGPRRSSQLPDVPTVAEAAGLPGYQHVSWGALLGPAKLPRDIVAKLFEALKSVTNDAKFQAFLTESGGDPAQSQSPAQFGEFLKAELTETIAMMTRLGLKKT